MTLFQGVPQAAGKMEEIIQKSVELGVSAIVPVYTRYSGAKGKDIEARLKRYKRVAEMAAGQSRRSSVPNVGPYKSFTNAAAGKAENELWLFAYENESTGTVSSAITNFQAESYGIWIGPEGGFHTEEAGALLKAGAVPVTLGRRILRTETAGPAALVQLQCALKAEAL